MKNLFIIAVCFVGALLLLHFFYLEEENQGVESQQEILFEASEIPKLQGGRKEQIIYHEGFTVSYNSDYRIANWVAYELTSEKAKSNEVQRYDVFLPDPNVKGPTATDADYRRSGFDRGHLVPAGDMKWSEKAMEASFYFSNICPQNRDLNSGLWHDLEKRCRRWAKKYGTLMIITGPVIEDNLKRIGENKVAVPNYFYKVVCTLSDNHVEGIGFIFDNRNYKNTSLTTIAIPIDSVERITGIDFFHSLPIEKQLKIESDFDLGFWGLHKK